MKQTLISLMILIASLKGFAAESSDLQGALQIDPSCSSGYSILGVDLSDSEEIQDCAYLDRNVVIRGILKRHFELMISEGIADSIEKATMRFPQLNFTYKKTEQGIAIQAISNTAE